MPDKIRSITESKNVLILGFGREGKSTFRFLRALFPEKKLTVADANAAIAADPLILNDHHLETNTGPAYLDRMNDFDLIIKTPGISLKDQEFRKEIITSQTDLFLQEYSKQVIGITGTKGKSTTSTLIHHIFSYAELNSILLGNIGRPAFDHIDEINDETKIVYEMSSHQLEFISKAPHIAILLNFYQEHLDAYRSYKDYRLAKWNIARFQSADDFLILNDDDDLIREMKNEFPPKGRVFSFSLDHEVENGCFIRDNRIIFRNKSEEIVFLDLTKKRKLQGEHNLRNIMAAMMAAHFAGADPVLVAEAVAGFRGLEHRLEDCGTFNGVHFYNDSIATIPEACIAALKALGDVNTLILGGFDRGIDYSGLAEYLSGSTVRNLIFTGEAGARIHNLMKPGSDQQLHLITKFDEFIGVVRKVTPKGTICLLSPAAASYDEFPNFEVRGRRFKELISDL